MRRAHAAADRQVEAGDAAALDDGDEAKVLGEHVDVVDGRQGDRRLELARQVGRAEDRLGFLAAAGGHRGGDAGARVDELLAVEPDLVIGTGLRQQVLRQPLRPLEHLGLERAAAGMAAGRDVSVDVAAGSDGVDQRGVHRGDGRLQLALDDAVHLEGLAGGHAQRAVGELVGDRVHREPLARRRRAARQARADHEAVGGLELLQPAFLAQVAVVLLVAAVELDQLGVVLAQRAGQWVGDALGERASQQAAGGLDLLDR